jgi:endoglucanase
VRHCIVGLTLGVALAVVFLLSPTVTASPPDSPQASDVMGRSNNPPTSTQTPATQSLSTPAQMTSRIMRVAMMATATFTAVTTRTSTAKPTATLKPPPAPTPKPIPSPPPKKHKPTIGYWHTQGLWIVNSTGHHIRLAGVTWDGMQNYDFVPAGLDFQHYTVILKEIKQLGFNVIRLPLSDELVERNPIVRQGLRANPDLVGLHALQVLDRIVAAAKRLGLRIILDNHKSLAGTKRDINKLDEPLWYTRTFSEARWIADWVKLAKRYRGNPTVVGFDLRNEPHDDGPGPWTLNTYLHGGATWGPYRGHDNPATDWRLAAERAGNAILSINPHLLIFVEGVTLWPDSTQPYGVEAYWWGSILRGVARYPVVLKVPHQLVYSPHEWGPRKWPLPTFNKHTSYRTLAWQFYHNWAFILNPHARYAAPIWLGEFGTCNTSVRCVSNRKPGSQGQWFQILIRYLKHHPYIGWAFFPINGTNSINHRADNGLLDPRWKHPRVPQLVRMLRSIEHP